MTAELKIPNSMKKFRAHDLENKPRVPRVLCPLLFFLSQEARSYNEIVSFLDIPEDESNELFRQLLDTGYIEEFTQLMDFQTWVAEQEHTEVADFDIAEIDMESIEQGFIDHEPSTLGFCDVSNAEATEESFEIC